MDGQSANRPGRASQDMDLKAAGEQGNKSRFPQGTADVPPHYSTCGEELRPPENQEEPNTWPLSAAL